MKKVKFITAIYSNLYGSDFGGRPNRWIHYRYSLLSLLKMTDADFLCYTKEDEIESLKEFFYDIHSISPEKLKLEVFDLSQTKFKDLINEHKNLKKTRKSDRCVEIQYSKFHWWWNEDKSYDYYYWIDSGLSHCGLIPLKYLVGSTYQQQEYYESPIFNNTFLHNLIDFTSDKIFVIKKDNVRNYWSGTVDRKWYTNFDMSYHVIGGLFGGHRDNWDNLVNTFERYTEDIIKTDKTIPMEENVMCLMYYNHPEFFIDKQFDTWWCPDSGPKELPEDYYVINRSFYKILEELNGTYE
jgi:hypothetical protein